MAVLPRLTLVTLAVRDVAAATAFYARLGWRASSASVPGEVSFFDLGGTALSLYRAESLSSDMGRPCGSPGGTNLALNQAAEGDVDTACDAFVGAGGTLVAAPAKADWGGRIAFVADPDGHVWEIAWNPFWPLSEDGRLVLPPPP